MRLSAAADCDTARAGRQPAGFCPYPSLAPFLPDAVLSAVIDHAGARGRERLWEPERVLWATLLQVLTPGTSQAACVGLLGALGGPPIAPHSGSFCKARRRLPERVPRHLAQWVAREAGRRAPALAAAHGRPVRQWDGTGGSLTDRPENQAAYPQPSGHQRGCGFPQWRGVVMRDAASGCLLEVAFSNLLVHDARAARPLWDQLARGDILVADRGFASYGLLWAMTRRGVGVVVRQHHARAEGEPLAGDLDDQLVVWQVPPKQRRPDFWDDDLPATMTVRVVRCRLADGTVVTLNTNLGPEFSAEEILALYDWRWDEEVSFRDVKQTLALDPLAACTPELARMLIWAHLLAYNLVRATLLAASAASGVPVGRLSVKHTLDVLALSLWASDAGAGQRVLAQVGAYVLPDRSRRPGQPRRVKRRHNKYPPLTLPRWKYPARERAG